MFHLIFHNKLICAPWLTSLYSHKPLLPGIQRLKRTLCVWWLENHDVIKSRQGSRSFLFAHLIYFSSSSKSYLSRNDNLQLATALVKKRFHLIQWFSNTSLWDNSRLRIGIVWYFILYFPNLCPYLGAESMRNMQEWRFMLFLSLRGNNRNVGKFAGREGELGSWNSFSLPPP